MEDSLGQKWKHREFALASVSDLSSPPSSASPGIARFDSDGLQIHHQSHQIPLSVDPRTVQLFKVSPVLSVCVVEGSDAGKKTLYSRGVTIHFRNEEESAAFHCVVQQWKKEVNTQEGNERIGTITAYKSKFDEKIESSSAKMYFHYYGQLLHQQNMLQDYVRTGTYHAAVIENRADFIGRVVVDVGAGSGILSLFAAQAGAKHVYAVEASEMAEYARKLIAGNPTLAQRITVIKGKVEDVELPEKADILISEPMGTLLVNERMLESYVIARDRFLSPTGKMFPAVGRIHMAPFTDEYLFIEIANKARSSGRMIGTGCESHGLYHPRTSAPAGLVVDSPSLIHAQLGHPSLAKLQHLVPRMSKLSHLSCESCQLGKHSRSSFSQSVSNRALSPFALVHSDIWGPSRVKSTLGFQYFVTFIDDYS